MRTRIIAGNWKMNKTVGEALELVNFILNNTSPIPDHEIVVCPPFTALYPVQQAIKNSHIKLGAQNMYKEDKGAYTGEISPIMLKDIGVKYVIIGHSERRHIFGESDELINAKLKKALEHNLTPIFCVGETLEEREKGITLEVIKRQLDIGLKDIPFGQYSNIVIAYEPVWAIGTGKTAKPSDAAEVHRFIRTYLQVQDITILYGGSVKPSNIKEIMAEPEIDGVLVGGASLDAASFVNIIRYGIES